MYVHHVYGFHLDNNYADFKFMQTINLAQNTQLL